MVDGGFVVRPGTQGPLVNFGRTDELSGPVLALLLPGVHENGPRGRHEGIGDKGVREPVPERGGRLLPGG